MNKNNQPLLKVMLMYSIFICFFSCKKENVERFLTPDNKNENIALKSSSEDKYNVFKGPQVRIGKGHVRSWLKVNHEDEPLELGIEFTPSALTGLPDHGHMYHFFLPLHEKAKATTPYDHVSLMWNPEGHAPGSFSVPHFDPHFMRITNEERLAIPEYTPGSAFDMLPPAAYRPQGYIPFPGGVVQMGKHWGAPPFPAPGTFTSVMIYGSYNGKMIFEEPMITLAHILNGGQQNIPFGQPQLFYTPGYYPTNYNVYKANGHYHISLSNFVWRQ